MVMPRMRGRTVELGLSVVVALGLGHPAAGATLPPGFTEVVVASGLQSPTAMAIAPDGRLFVCEQAGGLRVIKSGALLPTPFITLTVSAIGERGLLGVALDPAFVSNQYVYVYYTATTPVVHNRVSRFTASGDVAQPGSEVVLLDLEPLSATNHNGGAIHFGRDGRLFVGVGENAVAANSQSLANKLGKLLRIDADGGVPADNPFFAATTGTNRAIWALGLRNPFTFAVHKKTGALLINDVGQSTWEEVNDGVAGANYGWPASEGPTIDPAFVSPRFAYGHGASPTTGCAIAGGAFYDADVVAFPSEYVTAYFFGDLCSGWIRRLDTATNAVLPFASGINGPVDIQVSRDGALYYVAYNAGAVYRVTFPAGRRLRSDYDGDGVSDLGVFRSASGVWLTVRSSDGAATGAQWGQPGDLAVPGDYDGDGRTDLAVYRVPPPSSIAATADGVWYVLRSSTGTAVATCWGQTGDVPVPADYDGDGATDVAVFRPATGTWYLVPSGSGVAATVAWGLPGDQPVPGDFDGDGRADPTVFRPATGTWHQFRGATRTALEFSWGANGDVPLAGDYDGDGMADPALFRPATGAWYQLLSASGGAVGLIWGAPGDQPLVGDYDGDGRADPTVFRPSEGTWYQLRSASGAGYGILWGSGSDVPLTR
jgi:glucose/arabinose dehydrogenase